MGWFNRGRKRHVQTIVIDGGQGVGLRLDDLNASLTTLDAYDLARTSLERSPTIAACTHVVARLFRSLRLELERGTGQEVASHALLDLLNDRPNEWHTPSELWATIAEEFVHGGECILRVHWDGNSPRRISVWPYDRVEVEPYDDGWLYRYASPVAPKVYVDEVVVRAGERPGICHARMNLSRRRSLRSDSPWRGLETDVVASVHASAYRAEYFRQGGSPRLVAEFAASDDPNVEINIDDTRSKLDRVFAAIKAGPSSWLGAPARSLPEGVHLTDMGPKSTTDPMMIAAARAVDEKLAAAAGLPVIVLGNMERATYSNARQQMAVVVRDGIRPRLDALLSALQRDILIPMGGRNARLVPKVDTDTLVQDEAAVWNKIVLDRVKAKVIDAEEAREELGYPPGAPEPEPVQIPMPMGETDKPPEQEPTEEPGEEPA